MGGTSVQPDEKPLSKCRYDATAPDFLYLASSTTTLMKNVTMNANRMAEIGVSCQMSML